MHGLYRQLINNMVVGVSSGFSSPPVEETVTLTDITLTNGYASPEVTPYSGIMTYLSNISPVNRDPLQKHLSL